MKILRALLFCLAPWSVLAVPTVQPVTDELRAQYGLDPFYKKIAFSGVFPIVGSDKPRDESLAEAAWILDHMLGPRDDLRAALVKNKIRLAVMAASEFTTDIPEHATLQPKIYWDVRARGLGATSARPAVSCAEENLIGGAGDPYSTENILIHEFAHAVHETALNIVDPTFDDRLNAIYQKALASGKWKGKYASTNKQEYWAEGVQSWFDCNRENDSEHNHVNTRAELIEYDPDLAQLVGSIFTDSAWQFTTARTRMHLPHLVPLKDHPPPAFAWPQSMRDDYAALTGPTRKAAPTARKWPQLPLIPTGDSPPSPRHGKPGCFVVYNYTPAPVTVRWVNFEGRPEMPNILRPGFFDLKQTHAGHVWEVVGADGQRIGYFTASEEVAKVDLSPAPAQAAPVSSISGRDAAAPIRASTSDL